MKRKIIPLIKTYLLLCLCYLLVSVILAIFCTFIHLSSFSYNMTVTVFSYLILLVSVFFLFKLIKRAYLLYGFLYAFSYLLIMVIFHFDHIHIFIIIKPVLIMSIITGLYYLKKNNDV